MTGPLVEAGPMAAVATPQPMQAMPPQEPVSLTEGMPDPASIAAQKQAYQKSINLQLQKAITEVQQQGMSKKQAIAERAAYTKTQLNLEIDQQAAAESMAADQETNTRIKGLQEAAMRQISALENQSMGLVLEYNQRKTQEDLMSSQYQLQREYYEASRQIQHKMRQGGRSPEDMTRFSQGTAQTQLRNTFAPAGPGDTFGLAYPPGSGLSQTMGHTALNTGAIPEGMIRR